MTNNTISKSIPTDPSKIGKKDEFDFPKSYIPSATTTPPQSKRRSSLNIAPSPKNVVDDSDSDAALSPRGGDRSGNANRDSPFSEKRKASPTITNNKSVPLKEDPVRERKVSTIAPDKTSLGVRSNSGDLNATAALVNDKKSEPSSIENVQAAMATQKEEGYVITIKELNQNIKNLKDEVAALKLLVQEKEKSHQTQVEKNKELNSEREKMSLSHLREIQELKVDFDNQMSKKNENFSLEMKARMEAITAENQTRVILFENSISLLQGQVYASCI